MQGYLSQTGPKQWKGQGREAREVGRGGGVGGGRGGRGTAGRRIRWRVLEVTPKTPGSVASADTCYLWIDYNLALCFGRTGRQKRLTNMGLSSSVSRCWMPPAQYLLAGSLILVDLFWSQVVCKRFVSWSGEGRYRMRKRLTKKTTCFGNETM